MLEGYAAIYNNWITVGSYNGYQVREMDAGGIFDESLAKDPRVVLKFNHQGAYAATFANTLKLRSDDVGLWFEATVDTANPLSQAMVVEMETGLLREASVAFYKEAWDTTQRDDGEDTVITRGDLDRGDVSVVLFGANPLAWSRIKRELQTEMGERVLRSLGWGKLDEQVVRELPTVHQVELVEEVVDTTEGLSPTAQLWLAKAQLRLVNARR